MGQLFKNNAATLLTNSPGTGGTTLTVTAGTGNEFPAIESAGADYFLITVYKIVDGIEANHEVMKVTVRASGTPDSMTVVRAQEGTAAVAFVPGDRVELRITKGTMEALETAAQAHAATSKTTPVDADEIPLADSAASWVLKKLTWANLKATTKTYFDTLYAKLGANTFTGEQTLNNNNLKTIKTATFNSQANLATTTGAVTVDWTAAQNYKQTEPTGNITYTFTAPPGVCHVQLLIESDGSSAARTFTWPASVIWYGITFAHTANKKTVVNFWWDGTNYHGMWGAQV